MISIENFYLVITRKQEKICKINFWIRRFGIVENMSRTCSRIVDCVTDMLAGAVAILRAPEGQKAEPIAKLVNEIIPNGRQILEKFLTDKFFVGNEVRNFFLPLCYLCNFYLLFIF